MQKKGKSGGENCVRGNASLKIDQIGIPKGKMLTKPMVVNNLNYDSRKTDLRQKGKLYSKRRTKNLFEVSQTRIDIGYILHMHLMKGDWVVMNRQPTLHRPSMMEFRVLPQDVKIFKISLAVTKPLNADFDGDEINWHIPQNPMATTEVKELTATPLHILSPKNDMQILYIVQDAMVSMYLLTRREKQIKRSMFMQYLVDLDDLSRFNEIVSKLSYTGKALFSFLLQRQLWHQRLCGNP